MGGKNLGASPRTPPGALPLDPGQTLCLQPRHFFIPAPCCRSLSLVEWSVSPSARALRRSKGPGLAELIPLWYISASSQILQALGSSRAHVEPITHFSTVFLGLVGLMSRISTRVRARIDLAEGRSDTVGRMASQRMGSARITASFRGPVGRNTTGPKGSRSLFSQRAGRIVMATGSDQAFPGIPKRQERDHGGN